MSIGFKDDLSGCQVEIRHVRSVTVDDEDLFEPVMGKAFADIAAVADVML